MASIGTRKPFGAPSFGSGRKPGRRLSPRQGGRNFRRGRQALHSASGRGSRAALSGVGSGPRYRGRAGGSGRRSASFFGSVSPRVRGSHPPGEPRHRRRRLLRETAVSLKRSPGGQGTGRFAGRIVSLETCRQAGRRSLPGRPFRQTRLASASRATAGQPGPLGRGRVTAAAVAFGLRSPRWGGPALGIGRSPTGACVLRDVAALVGSPSPGEAW